MAFPSDQNEYTNPETGVSYQKDPTTGAWRRAASTDTTPYVKKDGDTMDGDLIQRPSLSVDPTEEKTLTTSTPVDNALKFRYKGSDQVVRCVTLPLRCCVTVIKRPDLVEKSTGGSGHAETGQTLLLRNSAEISPSAAVDETVWMIESSADSNLFVELTGVVGNEYTIQNGDLDKKIFVKQVFNKGGECEKVVRSAPITVIQGAIPAGVGVTFTTGKLQVYIRGNTNADVEDHKAWKWNSVTGQFEEVWVASSSNRTFQTTDAGSYVFQTDAVTGLNFFGSSDDADILLDERSTFPVLNTGDAMFKQCKSFNQDVSWMAPFTSQIDNTNNMFESCSIFTGDGLNTWDMSNVVTMSRMFYKCVKLDIPSLSNWDLSKCEEMESTFRGCTEFDAELPWTSFGPNISGLNHTFYDANKFTGKGLDSWDTSNFGELTRCFTACHKFTGQTIEGWDVGNVTSLENCFDECRMLDCDLNSWDTSKVQNFRACFQKCDAFNRTLNWNTSRGTNFEFMFCQTKIFNQPLSQFNTTMAVKMGHMFDYAEKFNQDISGWNTSVASNMDEMFFSAYDFDQDLSGWCVPKIKSKPYRFDHNSSVGFADNPSVQPQWGTCPPSIISSPVIS